MKKNFIVFLLIGICSSLAGKDLKLTEGLWYISYPENNGTLTNSESAYRFKTDGSVEIVYSAKIAAAHKKMRLQYKKKHGKDMPEIKCSWKRNNNKIAITVTVQKRNAVIQNYLIGKDPSILLPENKHMIVLLARKGAKLAPDQAKQFWKEIKEANRDRFAENLKLPANVKLAEPEPERHTMSFVYPGKRHWKDAPANSFQQKVVSAINKGPKLADDAQCAIPSLAKILASKEKSEILLQYLACHPQWRLYTERNTFVHAVRYFCDAEGNIVPTLHQYYSCFLTTDAAGKKTGDPALAFQFRFDIGFGGQAWNRSLMHPRRKTDRRGNTWNTRFMCGPALVNIFDQSEFPGRQMTKAALDLAEKEFASVLSNLKDWRKALPANSVRMGKPDLILRNSIQGGIYEGILWCNPGERGTVYLKAFEITKGTPLSVLRLKNTTNCISGWSNDPREQFCSGMYFTIYEGEWGQYYGARFEVWFRPHKGGAERKLFEKNYRIQGWQR